MSMLLSRVSLFALAISLASISVAVTAIADDDDDDGPAKPVTEIMVTAKRLDAARSNIEPDLGASSYTVSGEMVENRPGSESISISSILLQTPGVAQDGSGALRVRQSQGALQYRINGVILPEGVSDLGDSISVRIAQSVDLITGALPAQYGFQAGGVVDITTKNAVYQGGGQVEVYGGSQGQVEPAFEYGGSFGPTNVFVSGSYHTYQTGLASPDGTAVPDHDHSEQSDGFAFVDHIFNSETRGSLIAGISDDRFQIPNLRGLHSVSAMAGGAPFVRPLTADGIADFPSEALDDKKREANRYVVGSLLHTDDDLTLQAAGYFRESLEAYRAGSFADLLFKGLGYQADEVEDAYGVQLEAAYAISPSHTLRAGFIGSWSDRTSTLSAMALPVNAFGQQTSTTPVSFSENEPLNSYKASVYAQDEWHPITDLTINLGARFDDVRTTQHDTKVSPRASAVWSLADGVTLHTGYARYFLPAPLEGTEERPLQYAGTTAATPTAQGSPLQAETDNYYDTGVQWKAEDVTLGIDGYVRQAKNFVAEGQFGLAYLAEPFNYASANIKGVEFTANYADGPVTAWSNVAVSRGRGQTIISNQYYFTAVQLAAIAARSTPLSNDQTYTVSAGASYRWDAFRVIADGLYGSGLPFTPMGSAPNSGHLKGYAQANLALRYTVRTFNDRPLDIRFDVINVFDARYELRDGSGIGDSLPQWGPRRGFFAGVEQSF